MHTKQHRQSGISLLEVLISIFVVSIGLLGVLAVIPFGAFQISKAQHAEYASNMLANAAEEIMFRNMAKLALSNGANASGIVWFEPRDGSDWQEVMRGRDDLIYTAYTNKRPDFADQKNKIQSSGKYTWFFTFLPEPNKEKTSVDVLACYNRVPEDDQNVNCVFTPSLGGGTLTFPDAKHLGLLSQTKYIFMTWEQVGQPKSAWCKVVFIDKGDATRLPRVLVSKENLPNTNYEDMHVLIPSGVLYHTWVKDVPIR